MTTGALEVEARPEAAGRRSRFAAEGGLSMVWGLGVYGTALLTGPMLARALGPEGRGELASVVAPAQVLVFVLGFGVPGACAYFAHSVPRARLVGGSITTSLVLAAPVTVLLWFAAPAYLADRDPMTVTALRLLLVQALVTIVAQATNEHRRAIGGAGVTYNLFRSLAVLVNAAAVTVLFVTGHLGLASALTAFVAAAVVADVLTLASAHLERPRLHVPTVRRLWSFGSRSWVGTLSNAMSGRLDQVLLVGMTTSAQLGRYAVAVSAANVTIPIGQGAASAVLPHLRRGGLRTWPQLVRAVLAVGGIAAAVSLAVGLAAPIVLPLLFGDDFSGALVPLLVLLPGQVAGAAAEVLRADLASRGHPGQASLCQGIAAAVTVVLIVPAVHRWDITGAAAVTTLAYFSMLASATVLARRGREEPVDGR
jgi:O-antigen/teichoic acid export membrane protein